MPPLSKYQSYYCYIPIIIVLASGYSFGGMLTFGIHFLNFFSDLKNSSARLALTLFGMGVLGATVYCSKYWAVDMDEAMCNTKFLPHFYDFFGYLTTIVGGGVSGVILYLLFRTGITITLKSGSMNVIRFEAALVIAFCGGLFHFRVESILYKIVTDLLKSKEGD